MTLFCVFVKGVGFCGCNWAITRGMGKDESEANYQFRRRAPWLTRTKVVSIHALSIYRFVFAEHGCCFPLHFANVDPWFSYDSTKGIKTTGIQALAVALHKQMFTG